MFDLTTFLIRWLFLSNLARDVAEIQTLPCQPFYPHQYQPPPGLSRQQAEEVWRDQCIRGILSYPPGMQRLLVLDALRVELVQQLSSQLQRADRTIQRQIHSLSSKKKKRHHAPTTTEEASAQQDAMTSDTSSSDEEDPYLDADVEILKHFGGDNSNARTRDPDDDRPGASKARLMISRNGTNVVSDDEDDDEEDKVEQPPPPTAEEARFATRTYRDARSYLPQLVTAVLKSPPAFDPNLANPIQKLRQLLLRRCQRDPSWGIELCWILEAEVGRDWKALFEHRQQTGRRLIVVLPAEKAAVLAKIGMEKREAFDLLQDAEQATAYGYTFDPHKMQLASEENEDEESGIAPRLPSSLSLRRCSHFGDTMHLVDRLTQISLDLRMVPVVQRRDYLHNALHEMNRRLRRRMVTRGDVSIDVEDQRGPFDWPQTEDLTVDMLRYSVHFPLFPQAGKWPDGETFPLVSSNPSQTTEVVRVLNIVVPESRVLSSRERCPFLVHLEVADTELEGSDARLYTSGANNLGSTVEEALGMSAAASAAAATQQHPSFGIPPELFLRRPENHRPTLRIEDDKSRNGMFPRGGWQAGEPHAAGAFSGGFYDFSNPYDDVRQHEYEQLHQEMQFQQGYPPAPPQQTERQTFSVGSDLLDKVYDEAWGNKCKDIRDTSPFGHVKGWRLASFIMKAGEDIRKEALVMQIISKLRNWFYEDIAEEYRPYLRPYTIMCVGGDAGMLECINDAKSVDEVKKRTDGFTSLREYFERAYGPPNLPPARRARDSPVSFETAQDNFLRSLVGYSLVCYILQVKDRHNANILLDRAGHLMHIDFGFVLGETPKMGKVPIFSERAPFKLSTEFWEVLGGWNIDAGGLGVRFCKMFEQAFECASSHADEIATLVEGTMLALDPNPNVARSIANGVRNRLRMRGAPGSREQKMFVMDLVNAALTCWGTSTYDWLQRSMNGYL